MKRITSIFAAQNNNKTNITMGKGDKRTKRGKIIIGSYGVSRPKKTAKKAETKTKESK
jgi:30S ribosomal protein S31